jgi:hypothetical protein
MSSCSGRGLPTCFEFARVAWYTRQGTSIFSGDAVSHSGLVFTKIKSWFKVLSRDYRSAVLYRAMLHCAYHLAIELKLIKFADELKMVK